MKRACIILAMLLLSACSPATPEQIATAEKIRESAVQDAQDREAIRDMARAYADRPAPVEAPIQQAEPDVLPWPIMLALVIGIPVGTSFSVLMLIGAGYLFRPRKVSQWQLTDNEVRYDIERLGIRYERQ